MSASLGPKFHAPANSGALALLQTPCAGSPRATACVRMSLATLSDFDCASALKAANTTADTRPTPATPRPMYTGVIDSGREKMLVCLAPSPSPPVPCWAGLGGGGGCDAGCGSGATTGGGASFGVSRASARCPTTAVTVTLCVGDFTVC